MGTLSLADFRKRYPQTNGLTDEEMIGVIAQQYGASIDETKAVLNYEPPAPPEPRSRTWGEVAGDTLVTAAKSAIGLPQAFVGLIDIPTGGRVGKALEGIGYRPNDAQEQFSDLYSDPQKAANQRVADAQGFTDTAIAYAKNPSTILTTIGESSGQMLGGAGIARKLISAAPKLATWAAGALGEGAMGAGAAEEQFRAESEDGLTTAKQGMAALASGAGVAAFGALGGKVSSSKIGQKLGMADIDTVLASGAPMPKTPVGFLKAAVSSGISEGALEEMPQSAWEQMMQNYAHDKPILDGVGKAMAAGLVVGAAMGGGMGGYNAMGSKIEPPQDIMDQPDIDSVISAAESSIEQLPVQQPAATPIDDPMRLEVINQLPEAVRETAIRAYNLIIDDATPKGLKKLNQRLLDDILEQAASEMQAASETQPANTELDAPEIAVPEVATQNVSDNVDLPTVVLNDENLPFVSVEEAQAKRKELGKSLFNVVEVEGGYAVYNNSIAPPPPPSQVNGDLPRLPVAPESVIQDDPMPSVEAINESNRVLADIASSETNIAPTAIPTSATSIAPTEIPSSAASITSAAIPKSEPVKASDIPRGEVGAMFESGQVVATASGRETTPFPQIKTGARNTGLTLKQVDRWLMTNAYNEAVARGDDFNARQFKDTSNIQQADKDSAELYLFGDSQPKVVPSILKPLVTPSTTIGTPSPTAIPESTVRENGTLSIKGETKALQAQLKEAGIPSIPSNDGVTVGAKNVEKAQEFIASMEAASQVDQTRPAPKNEAAGVKLSNPAQQTTAQNGLTAQYKKGKTGAETARNKLAYENPFLSFLATHGVSIQDRADVGGEKGRAKLIAGHGPLFRKNGLRLDELAQLALEKGFITQAQMDSTTDNGGANALSEMIGKALRNEVVTDAKDVGANHDVDHELKQEATDIGIDITGKSSDEVYDLVKEHHDEKAYQEAIDALNELSDEYRSASQEYNLQELVFGIEEFENAKENSTRGEGATSQATREIDTRRTGETESSGTGTTETAAEQAQTSDAGGRDQSFRLTGETTQEANARIAKEEADTKSSEAESAKQDDTDRKTRIKKEIAARQESSADNFQLGQSAEDSLSGQASIFDESPTLPAKSLSEISVEIEIDDTGATHEVNAKEVLSILDGKIESFTNLLKCLRG